MPKATYTKHHHADPADKARCPLCQHKDAKQVAAELYEHLNYLALNITHAAYYKGCVSSIPKDGTVMVCGPIPKVLPLLLEAFSILWGNEKTLDLQVDTFHDPHFNDYRARIVLDCAQLAS